MEKNQETNSLNMGVTLPGPGILMETQRAAAENSARLASLAYNYAMSVNRAWFDLWNNRLTQYMELPKRLADAQTNFMEQAFDDYQESVQQLGGITTKATGETGAAMQQAASKSEEFVGDVRSSARQNIREAESRTTAAMQDIGAAGRRALDESQTASKEMAEHNRPQQRTGSASGNDQEPASESDRSKEKRTHNVGKNQRQSEHRRGSH